MTELVTVVVVMGLVIGPIMLAGVQAMKTAPQTALTSKAAADTALLLDRFTADIANASGSALITLPPYTFTQATVACGATTAQNGIFAANSWLVIPQETALASSSTGVVAYTATWTAAGSATKLTLQRQVWAVDAPWYVVDRTVFTGYCNGTETVATIDNVAGTGNGSVRRLSMKLTLRPTPTGVPKSIVLQGSVRDTAA